ncbi:MAG TPA: hypothetical protein VHI73_02935 [Solirubrobacteraceae bacterium]|jgi:hypothetical protein|nr:hypothetical protein [Solirubrobacteraceae bacterium]
MPSRSSIHPRSAHASLRLAAGLTVLALLAPAAAGCGGGGGQQGNTATTKQNKTGTTGRKPGPKAPRGGAVSAFSVKVLNSDRAQLTVVLKNGQPLVLRVNQVSGTNTTKVGKVKLGNKPAGRSVIVWDLKVSGHKLDPGRYTVVMRAGKAGRSKPVAITVPG